MVLFTLPCIPSPVPKDVVVAVSRQKSPRMCLIRVGAGKESQLFYVEKTYLEQVDYFDKAIAFKKANKQKDGEVELESISPVLFELFFLPWMKQGIHGLRNSQLTLTGWAGALAFLDEIQENSGALKGVYKAFSNELYRQNWTSNPDWEQTISAYDVLKDLSYRYAIVHFAVMIKEFTPHVRSFLALLDEIDNPEFAKEVLKWEMILLGPRAEIRRVQPGFYPVNGSCRLNEVEDYAWDCEKVPVALFFSEERMPQTWNPNLPPGVGDMRSKARAYLGMNF